MAARRDVKLGRIELVTIEDEAVEAVGDTLAVTGGSVSAGERRARPFNINLPVRGDTGEANPYAAGDRLRRQVRSLMQNERVKTSPIYFQFSTDTELNGWLLIGGGELAYSEAGVTLADYQLRLQECYKVGAPRTHRPANRIDLFDRRLSTTPRDYLGTRYTTDFSGSTATPFTYFPQGAFDYVGLFPAANAGSIPGIDGTVSYFTGLTDGDVISYERAEADYNKTDVVILDRRSNPSPTFTLAGDIDSQTVYGWEEVYGPDYPLTASDVPTVQNSICRTRWDSANKRVLIDQYVAATGYVNRGYYEFYRDQPAGTQTKYDTFVSAAVIEWTPERAVIKIVLRLSTSVVERGVVYIVLQRGWEGPAAQLYTQTSSATPPGTEIRYISVSSGTLTATSNYANYTSTPTTQAAKLNTNTTILARTSGFAANVPNANAQAGWTFLRIGFGGTDSTLGQAVLYDSRVTPTLVVRS